MVPYNSIIGYKSIITLNSDGIIFGSNTYQYHVLLSSFFGNVIVYVLFEVDLNSTSK